MINHSSFAATRTIGLTEQPAIAPILSCMVRSGQEDNIISQAHEYSRVSKYHQCSHVLDPASPSRTLSVQYTLKGQNQVTFARFLSKASLQPQEPFALDWLHACWTSPSQTPVRRCGLYSESIDKVKAGSDKEIYPHYCKASSA